MGASFVANYHSKCKRCGDRIEPGDEAGFDEIDQVCCKPCWDQFGDEFDYRDRSFSRF
ncbi:hypothetical protein [Streptomyces sp. NPDC059452]|uniref:hypothetical protein n=1 Tax=Streptomyces sp. NPDC059452 TaxID=3346835 RepID=UPI0036A8DBB4